MQAVRDTKAQAQVTSRAGVRPGRMSTGEQNSYQRSL